MLLLRFRRTDPTPASYKYVAYNTISKALNIPYNSVQHICRHALKPPSEIRPEKMVTKLGKEHISFLTNPSTLEQWAGKTLKRRTILFHRQFPYKRIAVTSLRRLYLKNGIKRKKVRQEKHMPAHARADFQRKCRNLLNEIDGAKHEGRKFIYLDEINFTKRSVALREWSGKNSNLTIDQEEIYVGYRSVIATMTEEGGILHTRIQGKAVDSEDFIDYLNMLRYKMRVQPVALFMDQLAVHKSKDVKEWYSDLDIKPVFNVGYSPEFNPIEAVFSKVKARFNSKRLHHLVNKTGFNADREIKAAFKKIKAEHCAACVRKSRHLLERAS